jgi:uroporphyrinogen-III synthase
VTGNEPTTSSLAGFTIGITADRRADDQAVMFRRLGAEVVQGPTIQTLSVPNRVELTQRTQDIIAEPPDYLIANTGLGIRTWLAHASDISRDVELREALGKGRIAARGPKAAGAVSMAGLTVWWRSPSEQLADVTSHLMAEGVGGKRIGFQLHGDDSKDVTSSLEEAGADAAGQADELRQALNSKVLVGCIGPVCAGVAREEGISAPVVPANWRLGSLVRAVTGALTGSPVARDEEPG